ncbi:hypothetical protein SEA_THUNDERCLAP_52 [Arthrobacter phage Thunderclap]|uniref:Uncharacterized protein n=6 Tax=Amigovirus amigo TaxID=1982100 RepID=A0A5J6TBT1_9CAUD|nr:hypothetical protein FDH66_gp50 [Arthrobacter phage Amigo]QFG08346.1 hypothetical protein SEA_YEEZUS_53 [Arthrobacter phage Yeezus]QFG13395.1 hypothetical protein SEA_ICHOR_53 [Arthrobacter phage Ichor]QFG13913.1 hypothetical protein SEA_JAEK_53 [Arthrobacter phage Jaek]QJD51700.1 hypothetical protein SEA_BOERSMA_55 [Arthrobacter phage Boersma]QOR56107.1 hypothetical protein SEA_THUNDERCLAP_52 [Arthrobacter phage Thunderclap]
MPIRVRIERVGYYEQHPDHEFHDILITRQDTHKLPDHTTYEAHDRTTGKTAEFQHKRGAWVEVLATEAMEALNNAQ